jgi:hypothetical protein
LTKEEYLANFMLIIPLLIIDIVVPIVKFIPNIRKQHEFKRDANFWGFLITLAVGNALIAYIIGILAYVKFESSIQRQSWIIWIISVVVISAIEGVFYRYIYKNDNRANIKISMSPDDYKDLILDAEKDAKKIWMMPKRITVMFKSDAMIKEMATARFGDEGSKYFNPYVLEHTQRKASFLTSLTKGGIFYELHNEDDLIAYIKSKSHIGVDGIGNQHLIDMIMEWRRYLSAYPHHYFVRIINEKIPIKYEIIDNKKLIIHESVGADSGGRLNAIMIDSPSVVSKISSDFSNIWERAPKDKRTNESVIKFIDDVLLPMLNGQGAQ